jgi:pimeloyl-ACP methyl ester carboxylesterase
MIEINGAALETRWWGPPPSEAPTLLLLHEGLGSVGLWRGFPAALADATGCGVVAYSRAGYGRSGSITLPRPLTYMHDEARKVLPELITKLQLQRFILVGHSDGGSIATIYAGSRQDFRLQGLVLIAPHFFVEDIGLHAIAAAKTAYDTGDLRTRLARHHDDVDAAFRGWNDAWLDPRFKTDFDLTSEIAHIRVPVLVVQSDGDPYGTMRQAETIAEDAYCPVEVLAVAGASHAPHLDAADVTLPRIAAFIRHLLRPATTPSKPPMT